MKSDAEFAFEEIDSMMKLASDQKMEVEVIYSFYHAAANGMTIAEACQFAIIAWDL